MDRCCVVEWVILIERALDSDGVADMFPDTVRLILICSEREVVSVLL